MPAKKRNKLLRKTACLLLFIWLPFALLAREEETGVLSWSAITHGAISSGEYAPFWVVSDRQGKFLPESWWVSQGVDIAGRYQLFQNWEAAYGTEIFGRSSQRSEVWLHQGYISITAYNFLRLQGGLWEEIIGSPQSQLSSGSIIWSGNARPMPKVALSTPGFIDVPFLGGYAKVSGLLSHGWFEGDRYAEDVWLHHKNLHLRLGGDFPVNLSYGLNHYAQWGGSSPKMPTGYPSDWEAYKKVFFIQSGDPNQEGTPVDWVINRFGNHIGSRNYGIDLRLVSFSAGIYLQDIFEDNSGYSRKNFPDGLWGLWLQPVNCPLGIETIVYEFLHTTHQSGPYHDVDGDTLGGNDNYMNHGHYRSGWTHYQHTLGSPLISSPVWYPCFLDPEDPDQKIMRNSRIRAHHLGLTGRISPALSYRTRLTLSRNYGTYNNPFTDYKTQFSSMLELVYHIQKHAIEIGLTWGLDRGKFYGDSQGFLFSVRKTGFVTRSQKKK